MAHLLRAPGVPYATANDAAPGHSLLRRRQQSQHILSGRSPARKSKNEGDLRKNNCSGTAGAGGAGSGGGVEEAVGGLFRRTVLVAAVVWRRFGSAAVGLEVMRRACR